jgi:prepilin-type processing-associated H-X9-DG protein
VVIAIIGILIALLLPAVQAAREAARRAQCTNNLKQLALAVHNYATAHGCFPPGSVNDGGGSHNSDHERESWGWGTFVLPFIEQEPLYEDLGVSDRKLWQLLKNAPGDRDLVRTPLAAYRCPSDTTPAQLPRKLRHFNGFGNPDGGALVEPGTSNYVASQGFYDPRGPRKFRNNGVLYSDSAIRFRDITDGTSKTIMFGERDERCGAAVWVGVRNPPGPCHWGVYHTRGKVSIPLNSPLSAWPRASDSDWPPGASACHSCGEGFSSQHEGGANFAFCDGSVHFIAETIAFSNAGLTQGQLEQNNPVTYDPEQIGIYQRLGIRDDGATVGEF